MEPRFEEDRGVLIVGGQRYVLTTKTDKKVQRLLKRLARRGDITPEDEKRLRREMRLRFKQMVEEARVAFYAEARKRGSLAP